MGVLPPSGRTRYNSEVQPFKLVLASLPTRIVFELKS